MSYSEGTVTANRGLGPCSSLSFRPDYLELTIWVSDWFGLGGLWDSGRGRRILDFRAWGLGFGGLWISVEADGLLVLEG